jgi:hypothetical protein
MRCAMKASQSETLKTFGHILNNDAADFVETKEVTQGVGAVYFAASP